METDLTPAQASPVDHPPVRAKSTDDDVLQQVEQIDRAVRIGLIVVGLFVILGYGLISTVPALDTWFRDHWNSSGGFGG